MKTIAVVSQKGGSGKTTIALHLAVAATKSGLNAAVIDLDPQASASKWSDRRSDDTPVILSAHASRLGKEYERVKDAGCDILILDTAPHSDSAALEAAKIADLVLIPCRPAILDMEAIASTLDLVKTQSKDIFVIMNAISPLGKESVEASDAIVGMGADVADAQLVNRVAYSRSLISGQTAQEIEPEGKAANEVEHLHSIVCAHIGV